MDKNECDYLYSESETEEHLNGKRDLFEWLKRQEGVTNAVLEGWLPETKQRPDILFNYNGKTCVIEYQCTPIASEYVERHELYQAAGIKDIWIAGAEKYFKPNARRKFIESHIDGYYNPIKKQYIPGSNTKQGEFMLFLGIIQKKFNLSSFAFTGFGLIHKSYLSKDFDSLRILHKERIENKDKMKPSFFDITRKKLRMATEYIYPFTPYIYDYECDSYILRKCCKGKRGFYKKLYGIKQNTIVCADLVKKMEQYTNNNWRFSVGIGEKGIFITCHLLDRFRASTVIQYDDIDIHNKKQIEDSLLLPLMKCCKEKGITGDGYVRVMEVRD